MKNNVDNTAELVDVELSSDSVEICSDELCKGNTINRENMNIVCSPCLFGDKNIEATGFCKNCEDPEPLCEFCAQMHIRQRATRNHEICTEIGKLTISQETSVEKKKEMHENQIFCEPCLYGDKQIEATYFCKTCADPEPLCENCAQQHTRHKASREHEISNDLTQLSRLDDASNQKKEEMHENQIFCEPCLYGDKQIEATYFCKTCADPEPLCDNCAQQHTRHKASREHEISNDLTQLSRLDDASNQKEEKGNEETKPILCDPCLCGNIQTTASRFCQTCEDPEPMCEACAQLHTRQKATKGHEISADIKQFHQHEGLSNQTECQLTGKPIFCEPCLCGNIQKEATHFCKTCDEPEPMCENCAQIHTRQKATRGHEINDDLKQFAECQAKSEKRNNAKYAEKILCEPCSFENLTIEATRFCETCEHPEPMCEACSKQHVRYKATRGHLICMDMEKFTENILEKGGIPHMDNEILCDPCLYENVQIAGTSFCKTCQDPEPLCDGCAQQHTRQKSFRHHEISKEIKQLATAEKTPTNKESLQRGIEILCDPCLSGDIRSTATQFCKTCEDPEPLCDGCAQQHKRQKATKHHQMSNDLTQLPINQTMESSQLEKEIFCDPCLSGDVHSLATKFCKTCDDPEPLCDGCAQQHTRQKATKHHEMSNDLMQFFSFQIMSETPDDRKKRFAEDDKTPGKPHEETIKSDSVSLIWKRPHEETDQFQIRFKVEDEKSKWKFSESNVAGNFTTVTGLMADTEYVFQVRGLFEDQEGPYGPVSDSIKTKKSLATTLLNFCRKLENSKTVPLRYQLPIEENMNARNESARTRQLILGKPNISNDKEKTIMLVGATGSGKSTLANGIINYITGVSFWDPFRFTMVTLEMEEESKTNQALSQTDWITTYKIYPTEGSRLNYTLNIIDTPGFYDTRGLERNYAIIDQIRQLFSSSGEQGVLYIDAVCFIVKAPDARLTIVQKYIFNSIMSLFGKDIKPNICTLITFADCAKPPVLDSLEELKLPFSQYFTFNNSALYAENNVEASQTLSQIFWEIGCKSFKQFFQCVETLITKSLCQTKDVLDEQEKLKTIISNFRPQVSAGMSKLAELKKKLDILKKYQNEIEDNENFEYTVEEATGTVTKTYADMKRRYEIAMGEKIEIEKYIKTLSYDVDDYFEHVSEMLNEMNRCKTRLKEIALRPDPLSTEEHIDLMIVSEEKEKQPGYFDRIKMLEECKKMSLINKEIERLSKDFLDTKEIKNSLVGTSSKEQSRNKSGILTRLYKMITS
ncbi:uncharacterized protein LOC111105028 isoform X2 [Crassostrea virginica]